MGEAAAVVGIVCGSRGSWLWSRPEANRRQADLDERQRGEFFDVLVQQADEARTRVREGTRWQGMPLLLEPTGSDSERSSRWTKCDAERSSSWTKPKKRGK